MSKDFPPDGKQAPSEAVYARVFSNKKQCFQHIPGHSSLLGVAWNLQVSSRAAGAAKAEVFEDIPQFMLHQSRVIPMESTPMSATYDVVTTGPAADPAERIRRMGQTMGLWDHELNFPRACRQVFRNFDFRGKAVL